MTRNQQGDFFGDDEKWLNFFRVIFFTFPCCMTKRWSNCNKIESFYLQKQECDNFITV